MLKALTGMRRSLDTFMIHYDAYVLEPSDNLDRYYCPKSNTHTFNGLSTREQYEMVRLHLCKWSASLVCVGVLERQALRR